ncbi:hypothetical protein A11A3_09225 [Alcanivorax hongdengensis A-11-3]|uniref:Outer membrane protein beta-barrel domain-containing protein n=1 Tax=Alcanivorax hongdengensis A-11-3 TaxID=1177179 RepID=L0WEY6_9GAMM|nr:outer membrane beta-barrel protein [Alcanivorax hongdengensis]EKF74370.1 hypothetical protein A11A3_09225 [Alcanivorax hongdengensis A-11-3]
MMKRTLLAASLLSLSAVSMADQKLGLAIGGSLALDRSNFYDELEDELPSGVSLDEDSAAVGGDIYVGLAFGGASTLRLGYRKFGDQDADAISGGVKTGDVKMEADGTYLAADLLFPLNDSFYLGGTLGLQNWDGKVTASGVGGRATIKDDARDFFYGLRGKALLKDSNLALTFSYNRYDFDAEGGDDIKYDSISVGLEGYFY